MVSWIKSLICVYLIKGRKRESTFSKLIIFLRSTLWTKSKWINQEASLELNDKVLFKGLNICNLGSIARCSKEKKNIEDSYSKKYILGKNPSFWIGPRW